MEGKKNWGLGIALLLILGLLAMFLLHQSNKNLRELEMRAERNVLLVKRNIQESYSSALEEIRDQYKIRFYSFNGNDAEERFSKSISKDFDWEQLGLGLEKNDRATQKIELRGEYINFEKYDDPKTLDWLSEFEEMPYLFEDPFGLKADRNSEVAIKEDYSLSFNFPISKLIARDEFANTFFDELMVSDSTGLIHYPAKWAGIKLNLKDSLTIKKLGTQVLDISLLDRNYKGYLTDIELEGLRFNILGALSEESMDQAAYQVNNTILVLLLILLAFIFLGIPLLAIYGLSHGDVLTQGTVIRAVFSLLFLLFVFGWTSSYFLSGDQGAFLEEENETIAQIKTKIADLDQIKSIVQGKDSLLSDAPDLIIPKEKLTMNSDGEIISFLVPNSASNSFKPLAQEGVSEFLSIPDREYFQKAGSGSFFISRQFSRKDGKPELVISTKPDTTTVQALTFAIQKDSLRQDSRRKFLVIKEDGSVIHASHSIKVPILKIQDLITEGKWNEMQILLRRNSEQEELTLRMNGNEYSAKVQELDLDQLESPLFLVYFIDTNHSRQFSSIVAIESVLSSLFYLLILGLLLWACMFLKNRTHYNWKRFHYYPLLYNSTHGGIYRKGVWVFSGILMLQLVLIFSIPLNLNLIILFLFFNLLLCFVALWLIYSVVEKDPKQVKNPGIGYSKMIFLFFLCISFIPAFWIYQSHYAFEHQIWKNEIVEENASIETFDPALEVARREMIFSFFEPNEKDLENFAFADRDALNRAGSHIQGKIHLGNPHLFLLFLVLIGLVFAYRFTHGLLYSTFFDIGIKRPPSRINEELQKYFGQESAFEENTLQNTIKPEKFRKHRIFLSGLQSNLIEEWVMINLKLSSEELIVIDCNKSGNEDVEKEYPELKRLARKQTVQAVLIVNIHCLSTKHDLVDQLREWLHEFRPYHLILGSGYSLKQFIKSRYGATEAGSTLEEKQVQITELMSNFLFGYIPIPEAEPEPEEEMDSPSEESSKRISGVLPAMESLSKPYNEKLWNIIFNRNGDSRESKEQKLWSIMIYQRHLKAYFLNLWSELSFEEKKLCYYLAKEGFINPKNVLTLSELIQKGVLYYKDRRGRYYFFDKTFRFFILNNTSRELISAFERDTQDKGNIDGYQWILVSFVILTLGVIAYFNRGLLTQIEAIATTVVGAIGVILNGIRQFIPSFNLKKKKE